MKAYLVYDDLMMEPLILGIFSTLEKAKDAIKEYDKCESGCRDNYKIHEFEVDTIPDEKLYIEPL